MKRAGLLYKLFSVRACVCSNGALDSDVTSCIPLHAAAELRRRRINIYTAFLITFCIISSRRVGGAQNERWLTKAPATLHAALVVDWPRL